MIAMTFRVRRHKYSFAHRFGRLCHVGDVIDMQVGAESSRDAIASKKVGESSPRSIFLYNRTILGGSGWHLVPLPKSWADAKKAAPRGNGAREIENGGAKYARHGDDRDDEKHVANQGDADIVSTKTLLNRKRKYGM